MSAVELLAKFTMHPMDFTTNPHTQLSNNLMLLDCLLPIDLRVIADTFSHTLLATEKCVIAELTALVQLIQEIHRIHLLAITIIVIPLLHHLEIVGGPSIILFGMEKVVMLLLSVVITNACHGS